MSARVLVVGAGMVPFTPPGAGDPSDVMAEQAARAALDDAAIDYDLVDQVFVSSIYGEHDLAQRTLFRIGMTGIPITRIGGGGVAGSSAFHQARLAVLSGEAECVLALGVDAMPVKMNRLSDITEDGEWSQGVLFNEKCEWLTRQIAVSDEVISRIVSKSRAHANNNPFAVLHGMPDEGELLSAPSAFSPYSCMRASGAAAVLVCSPRFVARFGLRGDVAVLAATLGSHLGTDLMDSLNVLGRETTRRLAQKAYEQAGIGPEDLDIVELHDNCVASELAGYGALGLCAEHELEAFVSAGCNTYGGDVVVGPSGGLLARGHAPGATGLAQIVELVWQLRGQAGTRQVAGARTGLQHNGASGSSISVVILQSQR